MTEFRGELHDDNLTVCPYCGHIYQPDDENCSRQFREEECEECGKKYHLRRESSATHETDPDCGLNGEEHAYEPFRFKDGRVRGFCNICGQIQPKESEGEP